MPADHAFSEAATREIVAEHESLEGPLLPILHAVQDAFGFIPEAAVPVVADALNLTRAEVWGVVSFYHDFRRTPPARHTVRLCGAEACQSMGGRQLAAWALENLPAETEIETVYCLGLCATAPSAMVDGKVHARLDARKLGALLEALD